MALTIFSAFNGMRPFWYAEPNITIFVPIASPDRTSEIFIAGTEEATFFVVLVIISKTSLSLKSNSLSVTKSETGIVLLFITVVVFSSETTSCISGLVPTTASQAKSKSADPGEIFWLNGLIPFS